MGRDRGKGKCSVTLAAGEGKRGLENVTVTSRARLRAELLRILWEKAHGKSGNGEVSISHQELAHLLQVSRWMVQQLLKDLSQSGEIRWERNGRANIYHLATSSNGQQNRQHQVLDLPNNVKVLGKLGLDEVEDSYLLGRAKELKLLREYIARGSNVLIVGPGGSGKSEVLRVLYSLCDKPKLFIRQGSPTKEFLVSLALELRNRSLLTSEVDFERVRNQKLQRMCLEALKGERYVLFIDNTDRMNLPQQLIMEPLVLDHQIVMTGSRHRMLRWSNFLVYELEPLSSECLEAIVELYLEEHDLAVEDPKLLAKSLARHSQGNLKKLHGQLERCRLEGYVSNRYVHENIGVVRDEDDYIDISPLVIVVVAVIVAVRFLGLGFDDRLLYVVAGMGYGFSYMLRYFMYRWRKPFSLSRSRSTSS